MCLSAVSGPSLRFVCILCCVPETSGGALENTLPAPDGPKRRRPPRRADGQGCPRDDSGLSLRLCIKKGQSPGKSYYARLAGIQT